MMTHTRISLTLAVALALAATTLPLHAQEQAAEQATAAADDAPAKKEKTRYERRICKSTAPTGTRIAKKTCLTQAQWEEAERRSQDATDTAQKNQLMINRKIEGGQ